MCSSLLLLFYLHANMRNIKSIAAIPEILELNIGHSIISRAIFSGLSGAVQEMKKLIDTSALL